MVVREWIMFILGVIAVTIAVGIAFTKDPGIDRGARAAGATMFGLFAVGLIVAVVFDLT